MKKAFIWLIALIFIVSMTILGIGCKGEAAEEPSGEAAEEAAEEVAPSTEVTLRYLGTTEIQGLMLQEVVSEYEEATGVKVELELLALGDSMAKARLELSKGSDEYDILEISTYDNSVYFFNDWLANIDELEESTGVSFNRETFSQSLFNAVTQLDGKTLALPFLAAANGPLQYRTDLMNDPDEMAAFKDQYGYELKPPTTWDQFYDVAEFFTRDTDDDGEIDFWGTNAVLDAGGAIYDQWLLRYLTSEVAADATPKYNYLFTEDLQPRFNSDAGVRAIEDIKKLYEAGYIYPGSLSMDWSQIVEPLSIGDSFMAYMWAETISPSMMPQNSDYAEVSAWAPLPIYEVSRMEMGAWILVINKNSKNKEEAYKFIQWVTSAETEAKLIAATDNFKLPARTSNYDKTELFEGFEFYDTIKSMLSTYEVLPELFLPEVDIVQVALNTELQRVITGEKDGETALNDAAEEIIQGLEDAGAYDRVK